MAIKFYNLKEQFEDQSYEIQQAITEVEASGQYFANKSFTRF